VSEPLVDLAPLGTILLVGVLLAAAPLIWVWRRRPRAARLDALAWLAVFLTFDLVLFGAYTRLSDSGLGCPDWPGCYGEASPFGAASRIESAARALPSGPVTHAKAWVEMAHRYFATGVGALIVVFALLSWLEHRRRPQTLLSPWWPTLAVLWVCVQGAFGALTVTMKLYPAIVTAHLLGGLGLLALLAGLAQARAAQPLALPAGVRRIAVATAALCVVQIALGGWVSTNYAVLACTDFPTCQGSWWPAMDFADGFTLRRELGTARDGAYLTFAALTAIHYTHRLTAYAVLCALAWLAWRLHRTRAHAARRFGVAFGVLGAWQLASGLANVTLGWPLAAALAHTAGAAGLVVLFSVLLVRGAQARLRISANRTFATRLGSAS